MNFDQKVTKEPKRIENSPIRELPDGLLDQTLQNTLRDFRLSVHAWSDTAYNRNRTAFAVAPQQRAWRRATAWALGCVLAMGVATGGVYERRHQQELARAAAQREAESQRQLAEQHAREADEVLAKVDVDVSRQTPNAMEPLARLMAEDESQ